MSKLWSKRSIQQVWNEFEMALLGLNLGQRTVVLTVFVVFGALSLFLIVFHVEAEAQFDELKIGGAPYPGTFTIAQFFNGFVPQFHVMTLREPWVVRSWLPGISWCWTLKGESDDKLVHFVQVSDIHISTHHEEQRTKDFHIFCSQTLKLINPEVVVITGDLTDAKSANKLDSVQYQSEWDDFIAGIQQIETKGIGFDSVFF